MTKEELIQSALHELEKLSPEEREIIYEHLGSRLHADLARRIADEATQLWHPADESGVAPKDWVREYLNVTIDLFHDQKMAFEMDQLRAEAEKYMDGLGPNLRAMVCCTLGTSHRNRLVFIVAKLAHDAIVAGFVDGADRKAAVRRTLEVQLASYIENSEATYFAGARRGSAN